MGAYIDLNDSNKMIRVALARAWPGVKFSVRGSRYAGGCSVDVRYTNGPPVSAVNSLIGRFTGASFDGMRDLENLHDMLLDGSRVHFACKYASASRDITDEAAHYARAEAMIRDRCHIVGEPGRERWGGEWLMTAVGNLVHSLDFTLPDAEAYELAFRAAALRDFDARERLAAVPAVPGLPEYITTKEGDLGK